MRQALLIATHVWNAHIASGMRPFMDSAAAQKLDVHVLFVPNAPSALPEVPPNVYLSIVHPRFIRVLYRDGWEGPWASNHWNLMWFWRHFRHAEYDRVWSVEYDVRHAGNGLCRLWSLAPDADYIASDPVCPATLNGCYNKFMFEKHHIHSTCRQVSAYSARFLNYLDKYFRKGINEQDEYILATLCIYGGFTHTSLEEHGLLDGSWESNPQYAPGAMRAWQAHRGRELQLFHPIKCSRAEIEPWRLTNDPHIEDYGFPRLKPKQRRMVERYLRDLEKANQQE